MPIKDRSSVPHLQAPEGRRKVAGGARHVNQAPEGRRNRSPVPPMWIESTDEWT